ncbi:MAG TPA: hypothetical protein VFA34_05820 [Actinomycetota bacterium]|nr:hypothetical protein [Actinomycetota bacterium]
MFWTVRVPDSALHYDKHSGTATLTVRNVRLFDHYHVANALAGGPAASVVASFVSTWKPEGKAAKVSSEADDFTGMFRDAVSTIEWESRSSGFGYRSDPAKTSSTVFALIGSERNGAFNS